MIDGNIRLLAAIMFTDMVGYTSLMQEDEDRAIILREKHRKILEKEIPIHQGKILQYYGDGTLSIFGSAIESVRCAISIQREMMMEPKIPIRVGIHLGDIVYEDDGVYGDGVNVASRIESLSVPGGILISDKIFDEIKNHPEFTTSFIGSFELKNVRRPIEIFTLTNTGLAVPTPDEIKSKVGQSYKSIAVLPFVNMSSDQENEYFSDGITEEILNALAKVEGLQVTSRTSAFVFKGQNLDIREIGNKLNVNTVLEGSVRKVGNKVRITAQLINTVDGYHVWSDSFDRNLEDIFEVQDEISRKIANILREKLTRHEINKTLVSSRTQNLEAYNYFLKGMYHFNKFLPDEVRIGIECFEKAIEIEPRYAAAYAHLSGCYVYLGAIGHVNSMIAYPKAKELATKSLAIDDTDPTSHLSMAMVKMFFDWDWAGAEKSFLKALEIKPNFSKAYHYYAIYLTVLNRYDHALKAIQKGLEIDPLAVPLLDAYADICMNLERFDEARTYYEKVLDLDPTFRNALHGLGWLNTITKNYDEAFEVFRELHAQTENALKGITPLGFLYGLTGKREEACECIEKLKKRKELEPEVSLNFDFAVIYMGLKDYDKVFEYLDNAYEERSGGLIFLNSIYWHPLKNDPRFRTLMQKMGLDKY